MQQRVWNEWHSTHDELQLRSHGFVSGGNLPQSRVVIDHMNLYLAPSLHFAIKVIILRQMHANFHKAFIYKCLRKLYYSLSSAENLKRFTTKTITSKSQNKPNKTKHVLVKIPRCCYCTRIPVNLSTL